jgi:hypothetical protein
VHWGNWYILRSDHEFGWPGANSVLSLYGTMQAGHRILIDSPARVRKVDVAVGQLIAELRHILILHYCWDRNHLGYAIRDYQRAQAVGVSNSTYEGLLGLAERTTNICLRELDNARKDRESTHACVTASAVVATSP